MIKVKVRNIKVTDADTFRGDIRGMGKFKELGINAPFRVKGIDAPESTWRAKCPEERGMGLEAKQIVTTWIEDSLSVYAIIDGKDKYGRYLADLIVDGQDMGEYLISIGLAKPYDGGTKEGWC